MKYKTRQLVWYVDEGQNIIQCIVTSAKLDVTESPIYSLAKIEHATYGANGEPLSFVLSDDWRKHRVDEFSIFPTIADAQEFVDRAIEFITSMEEDGRYSAGMK
jgi:hypothetical protein